MKYKLKTADFNLFLLPSDTGMTEFIEEVWTLGELFPEIYKRIAEDQDVPAKGKKNIRMLNRHHMREKTSDILGFRLASVDCERTATSLGQGRPRMSPELVFLFSRLRGYWGSVSDHDAYERMRDSMTLHVLFMNSGICFPGITTILENINYVSTSTHNFIFECQLKHIKKEGLDDFLSVQLDSTSVKASSSWPTDAGVILKLLNRVYACGKKLNRFGMDPFKDFYMPTWLKELKALLFEINNTGSKKEKKLKSLYNRYLKTAHKTLEYLSRTLENRIPEMDKTDRSASLKASRSGLFASAVSR